MTESRALAAGLAAALELPESELLMLVQQIEDETEDDPGPEDIAVVLYRVLQQLRTARAVCQGAASAEPAAPPTEAWPPLPGKPVVGDRFEHQGTEYAVVMSNGGLQVVRASALEA